MKRVRFPEILFALAWLASSAGGRTISVSEIQYNPIEGSDYEYIEIVNLTQQAQVLTGARFTNAIEFTFPTTTLAAGARIIIAGSPSKFASRYGSGLPVAKAGFTGKLDDQGEEIALVDANRNLLFRCKYDSDGSWPSRPNGLGSSLECLDPDGDLSSPKNWRAGTEYGGSPGVPGVGPQNLVAINEILAHTDPPLEDALELLNLTDQRINIGGWYVSNNRSKPKQYRFPPNTFIEPRGYRVVFEYQFNPKPSDPTSPPGTVLDSFTFNSANGDEAVLMSSNPDGSPKWWIDTVSFEASENGASFGRVPDGIGPMVTLADLSLGTPVRGFYPEAFLVEFRKAAGAPNSPPKVGPIAFRRIQYHPADGEDEFLEIENITSNPVPLHDPLIPANAWKLRGGVDLDFPPNLTLPAGGKMILCGIPSATFRAKYGIADQIPIIGPWTNQLSNAGDRVALYKPDPPQKPPSPDAGLIPYILVEEVEYGPTAPWPEAADGTGEPLQRVHLDSYANDPTNWTARPRILPAVLNLQRDTAGWVLQFRGTPGIRYDLESQASLGNQTWITVSSQTADTLGAGTFRGSISQSTTFLRVVGR